MSGQNMNRAARAWGANPPDWIVVLATECDRKSQAEVGRELQRSGATVNQVLSRTYQGRLDRFEILVRGRYMKATVQCPVLGEISTNDCAANQKQARAFRATNPLRVRLYTACRTCPHRERDREASDAPK